MAGALLKGTAVILKDGILYILKPGEYQTISSWLRDDNYDEFADKVDKKGNAIKFLAIKYSDDFGKGKDYNNFLERLNEELGKSVDLEAWAGACDWEEINNLYKTSGLYGSRPSDILFIKFGAGDDDHNGLSVRSFTSAHKLNWFKKPRVTTTDYSIEKIVT